MALTEFQRNSIARYKIQIQDIRRDILRITEAKKYKIASLASQIKSARPESKSSLRQTKISATNDFKNQIERKRSDIERIKQEIARIKS